MTSSAERSAKMCRSPEGAVRSKAVMNKLPIGRLAALSLCVVFVGAANAECLSVDNRSDACRYPAGDAWCARHGDAKPYAYKDDCAKESDRTATPARPPVAAGSWKPVPAWDCAKARSGTERLICANPDIRAQDARMGALYARLQARGQAPERGQKAWLLDQRNACDSPDCLRDAYAERIRYLERIAGSEGAPVEERSYLIAGVAPPQSAAPAAATRPPESAPGPEPESSPEPLGEPVPEPLPTTTADASPPRPETGIPELPPPEGPTLESNRLGADVGSASDWADGTAPVRGSGAVSASIAALALAIGLILWRRARILAAIEPSRQRLARLGQGIRTAQCTGLAGLRDLRARVRASARPSAPAPEAASAMAPTSADLRLSEDVAARLRALARPREPLPSVVARAVAALEAASKQPPPDAVLSRLAALEARLAQLDGTSTRERA